LFEVVYNNSTSVVWELEDKEFFNELIDNGWFDSDGVKVISMEWDLKNYFKVIFKVTWWNTFNWLKKVKLLKNIYIT